MSKVKLDIDYRTSVAGISPEQLSGFFEGWPRPLTPSQHLELLRRSDRCVLAREPQSKHIVGFITAITDGMLSAYIPLLEVRPDYRGRGIGRELVLRMSDLLAPLYMMDLVCDEKVQPFYERLGFTRYSAMIRRDHDALGRLTRS